MTAKTLAALKQSIAHWERLSKDPLCEGIGVVHCALCELFYHRHCVGCPVRERTGEPCCEGTPYGDVEWEICTLQDWGWRNSAAPCTAAKAACRAELKFLKSLLPKKETKP